MATSRTGTTAWKNLRKRAIYRAKRAGLTNCPLCNITLDYDQGLTPRSAEVDHVLPYSKGGEDHLDNTMVLCRLCNQRKSNKTGAEAPKAFKPIRTSRQW